MPGFLLNRSYWPEAACPLRLLRSVEPVAHGGLRNMSATLKLPKEEAAEEFPGGDHFDRQSIQATSKMVSLLYSAFCQTNDVPKTT